MRLLHQLGIQSPVDLLLRAALHESLRQCNAFLIGVNVAAAFAAVRGVDVHLHRGLAREGLAAVGDRAHERLEAEVHVLVAPDVGAVGERAQTAAPSALIDARGAAHAAAHTRKSAREERNQTDTSCERK